MRVDTKLVVLIVTSIATATVFADIHCPCGTVMHSPDHLWSRCPSCGRPVGNTGPTSSGNSSGLWFNIRVYPTAQGIRVSNVLGPPAAGVFYPNDIIQMGGFQDQASGRKHKIQILHSDDLDRLKNLAGPNNLIAIKVYRPTSGPRYFFVTLTPPGGSQGVYGTTRSGPSIVEDSGAAAYFDEAPSSPSPTPSGQAPPSSPPPSTPDSAQGFLEE